MCQSSGTDVVCSSAAGPRQPARARRCDRAESGQPSAVQRRVRPHPLTDQLGLRAASRAQLRDTFRAGRRARLVLRRSGIQAPPTGSATATATISVRSTRQGRRYRNSRRGRSHLVASTSVVQSVSYTRSGVHYRTFDASAIDVAPLDFRPTRVSAARHNADRRRRHFAARGYVLQSFQAATASCAFAKTAPGRSGSSVSESRAAVGPRPA